MIVVGFFETMPCVTLTSIFDFSQAYGRSKKNKTYICKPETGCQGKGIFVTKNLKDIRPYEHIVCQQYISKVRSILLGYLPFSTPKRRSDLWKACANPSSKIWGWISSPPHNASYSEIPNGLNFYMHAFLRFWISSWKLSHGLKFWSRKRVKINDYRFFD